MPCREAPTRWRCSTRSTPWPRTWQLRLHGAHLDHGLRGAASDADARFVVAEFRRLGVANTCERAYVEAYRREHRLSLEEAAREVRYAFLARVAERQGA